MTMMDDKIERDLAELYNGGRMPGVIQDALRLDELGQTNNGQTLFATRALPDYYYGDRKAKTVMVMLHPGKTAEVANENFWSDIECRSMRDVRDIENYHNWCMNYGHVDRCRQDSFDLKLAFFLHDWEDTGISLPENLCANSDKQTMLDAKEIVLTQKLTLELIPYATRICGKFKPEMAHLLVPFVETILYEIFSCNRKYVIFCSGQFKDIFEEYNNTYPNTFHIDKNVSMGKIGDSEIPGSCSIITICYKSNKPLRAIIANTLQNQALTNAYPLMELYGKFCYNEYIR